MESPRGVKMRWRHNVMQEKLFAKPSGGTSMGGETCPEQPCAGLLPAVGVRFSYLRAALFLGRCCRLV